MVLTYSFNKTIIRAWSLFLLLFGATANAMHKSLYDLPSFSLMLKVNKADKALVVFQDRLQNAIHEHLVDFFEAKVQIPNFGDGSVDEVALRSNLVWKQLSPSDFNGVMEYEVRGDFDCELTVAFETAEKSAARLSKSIMDLFLIESFQGDNYWHLVHNFLSDEMLEGITDVKITVVSDGYIAYNGEGSGDSALVEDDSGWTGAMTVGVIFASFFFFVLILMWIYICFFVKGTLLFKTHNPYPDDLSKATVTDQNSSENSLDFTLDDGESQWMDAWANAVTSIPLREPKKKKKKMKNSARHPAQCYRSYLDSIHESAEDDCSFASLDEEGRRELQLREQQAFGSDDCSLASVDEQVKRELEARENQKGTSSQAIVPFHSNSRALVVAKSRSLASRNPSFNFRRTAPEFNFMTTQPQLEKLDEMC